MFRFLRYEVRVTDDACLTLRWRVATLGRALEALHELHQNRGDSLTESYVHDRWFNRNIHHNSWS